MLALTEGAAEVIRALTGEPAAEGVRISAASMDGDQPAFQIEVAEAPKESDAVVEAAGAQLFLEPTALVMLDDKVLDADVDGDQVRFSIMTQAPTDPPGPETGPAA